MKMLETSIVSNANAISVLRKQSEQYLANGVDRSTNTSDKYIGKAANDAVFAKALTSALSEYMPEKKGFTSVRPGITSILELRDPNNEFRTDVVRSNVLNGIKSAIQSFAQSGASTEELRFLKDQAIKGIEQGFENASKELSELTGDEYSEKLSLAKASLMESVTNLSIPQSPSQPFLNKQSIQNPDSLSFELKNSDTAEITFGLNNVAEENSYTFTTLKNSISMSIGGTLDSGSRNKIVESVNQVERLVETFFKTDIERVLASLEKEGMSVQSILQKNNGVMNVESINPANRYKQIEGLEKADVASSRRMAQIKDYAAQMSDMVNFTNSVFASQNEYKQIINGLVNQMKDVQVPDLLTAINRIHSFNKRFM